MDEFLQVFGNLTVASVAVVIAALVFVWKLYTICLLYTSDAADEL